jgi:phosphopantothenoylcysteine decarboxylase/phosphopantothenate--cysteine ligase
VTTACDLYDAALESAVGADLTIACAAVADWRPERASESKVKKTDGDVVVKMVRNPDILAALSERKRGTFLVGFAAETDAHERNAREKLEHKQLDAIAVNDVRGERGFGTGDNALVLLWGRDGRRDLGAASKNVLAARLLDAIEELMACS